MWNTKKLPHYTLGSCSDCLRIFSDTENNCKFCNKLKPPSRNINIFNIPKAHIVARFYGEKNVKQIPCPKCNNNYLPSPSISIN